jgi:hypothetical protein
MMHHARTALLAGLLTAAACSSGADETPKLPLGHPELGTGSGAAQPAAPTIVGEAKVALDSGNVLYRARAYDLALAQYRRAAGLAPEEEAPLFGMLMIATATKNMQLADSATALIKALSQTEAGKTDAGAEMLDVHSRAANPHPWLADSTADSTR